MISYIFEIAMDAMVLQAVVELRAVMERRDMATLDPKLFHEAQALLRLDVGLQAMQVIGITVEGRLIASTP